MSSPWLHVPAFMRVPHLQACAPLQWAQFRARYPRLVQEVPKPGGGVNLYDTELQMNVGTHGPEGTPTRVMVNPL